MRLASGHNTVSCAKVCRQQTASCQCSFVRRAVKCTAVYNLWVGTNVKNPPLVFFPHYYYSFALDFCSGATFISGKQRASEKPLLHAVYSAHMADVFALQLKQGQSYALARSLAHSHTQTLSRCSAKGTEWGSCTALRNELAIFHAGISLGLFFPITESNVK